MSEPMDLALGEERAVHLPALAGPDATWTCEVDGMASAVDVRKLWAADPYPEDDDDPDDPADRATQDVVFMVRGVGPGEATLRFTPADGGAEPREVRVTVTN